MSSVAITEKAANISPAAENLRRVRMQIAESGDFITDEEIKAAREEKTAERLRMQREVFLELRNKIVGELDYITIEELDAEVKELEKEKFPPHMSAAEVFNIIRTEIVANGEFMTEEEINAEIKAAREERAMRKAEKA